MKYRSSLFPTLLVLAACSGGGGSDGGGGAVAGGAGGNAGGGAGGGVVPSTPGAFTFDTGIGGSGGLIGTIDGFGSIILNGLVMETDSTEFFIEGESGSESGLREGYYVVVAGDLAGLDADEVYYRSNIKGPVSAAPFVIDALTGRYEFTVLGQTVVTSATTRFDGVLAANIVQGDELEVSGAIDGDGRVVASYIELENSLTEYKAIGLVAALDNGAMTFDLGGLLVDYATASRSEFEGASLANGQLVEVRLAPADFNPATASATATELELLPEPEIEEGAELEIEGYIDRFVSASDFSVGGVAVTTNANTTYEDGDASQLGLNVKVEVEGIADANGVIVADQIELESDNAIRVQGEIVTVTTADGITGTVETALGVIFEVRASTELEDESSGSSGAFTLNNLVAGDYIQARGFLEGAVVVAVELEKDDPDPRALLRGPIESFSEPAGTLVILGNTITEPTDPNAFEDEDGTPISRAAFYAALEPGKAVKADWDNFGSLADPADEFSLEDDD